MNIIRIDGKKITDRASLYQTFAEGLPMEDGCGKNLDALADILSTWGGDCRILLIDQELLLEHLGDYGRRLLTMLKDMEKENPEHIRVQEPPLFPYVVFDLDGTLLDTIEDLKESVNHAMRTESLPERNLEEVLAFVGNGIRNLIHRAVPEGTDPETEERAFAAFKAHYLVHCEDKTAPYPGIIDLLKTLKAAGIGTAIVSNKNDVPVKKLSEKYFGSLIDIAIGENEAAGIAKKPAPDTVFGAMKLLGASKQDTVYVGDSEVDAETAANAGLPVILVSWGFRKRERLEALSPDLLADTVSALEDLILGNDAASCVNGDFD